MLSSQPPGGAPLIFDEDDRLRVRQVDAKRARSPVAPVVIITMSDSDEEEGDHESDEEEPAAKRAREVIVVE